MKKDYSTGKTRALRFRKLYAEIADLYGEDAKIFANELYRIGYSYQDIARLFVEQGVPRSRQAIIEKYPKEVV